MIRVAMVSGIRPETNYTTYLIQALQKIKDPNLEVLAYCEKDPLNLEVPLKNLNLCWNRDWRYVYQILLQAKKDKVDVLHFQHEINMFGGPRTAVLFPLLIFLARISGFQPVVTLHAAIPIKSFDEDFLKVFEWPRPNLLAPVVKIIFPTIYFFIGLFAKKIIVHSSGIKNILASDYKINSSKIEVIAHGVPEDVSYQLSAVGGQLLEKISDKKFLLYFGYLHRRKGLEYLVAAFKKVSEKYPDLILVLAGGTILPNYTRELEAQIKSLNLTDRIFVTGFLGLTGLRYLLSRCEFVVLPAVYSIAASGPLAQVFAHEKAVIVSDLGVYREEIQNGVNGLLAKVRDEADLANKIELLLTDPELKRKIINEARLLREERSWVKIAGRTLKIYEDL